MVSAIDNEIHEEEQVFDDGFVFLPQAELVPPSAPTKWSIISQLIASSGDYGQLDSSEQFHNLCEACRRGDIESVEILIANYGVNPNSLDEFDYSPLILASLCGHYDVVKFLLECGGAILDRHSFQGERCLYGALNNQIRDLLLKFDVSKAIDPTQPFASYLYSLLTSRGGSSTTFSDFIIKLPSQENSAEYKIFNVHRFVLMARSNFFKKQFSHTWRDRKSIKLAYSISPRSLESVLSWLYSGEVPEVPTVETYDEIKLLASKLELPDTFMRLVNAVRDGVQGLKLREYKLAHGKQLHQDFMNFMVDQVLTQSKSAPLCERDIVREEMVKTHPHADVLVSVLSDNEKDVVLFAAHRAMLCRSEFFSTMYASNFMESLNEKEDKHILPIVEFPMSTEVTPLVLSFIYSDRTDIPYELGLDVLQAADYLLLAKLKSLAAITISDPKGINENTEEDIYQLLRAAWQTNTQRLEYVRK